MTSPPRLRAFSDWDRGHLFCRDVISMPDTWERPWFAAWDLAFHMGPMNRVEPGFAEDQVIPMLREWYLHPKRQGSGLAIARTTPALLGLFSRVVLWMNDLVAARRIVPHATAWSRKTSLTFSDAIAAVRREIWHHQTFAIFRSPRDIIEMQAHICTRTEIALAHAR